MIFVKYNFMAELLQLSCHIGLQMLILNFVTNCAIRYSVFEVEVLSWYCPATSAWIDQLWEQWVSRSELLMNIAFSSNLTRGVGRATHCVLHPVVLLIYPLWTLQLIVPTSVSWANFLTINSRLPLFPSFKCGDNLRCPITVNEFCGADGANSLDDLEVHFRLQCTGECKYLVF